MPGYIEHHQYLTDNIGVISNKREIFQCNKTREVLLKVDHGRWTTVQLITYMHLHSDVQVDLDMITDEFVSRNNRLLDFSYTYANEKHWIIHDE